MSFSTLNKDELVAVGEMFAVDLDKSMRKDQMIKELEESGVDFGQYQALLLPEEEPEVELALLDPTPLETEVVMVEADPAAEVLVEEEPMVVVKMTRTNPTYEVMGYRFTKENPFMLVTEDQADILLEMEGFEMARPKEIKEYYAQ